MEQQYIEIVKLAGVALVAVVTLMNAIVAVVPKWRHYAAPLERLLACLQRLAFLQPPDSAGTLKVPGKAAGPLAVSPPKAGRGVVGRVERGFVGLRLLSLLAAVVLIVLAIAACTGLDTSLRLAGHGPTGIGGEVEVGWSKPPGLPDCPDGYRWTVVSMDATDAALPLAYDLDTGEPLKLACVAPLPAPEE